MTERERVVVGLRALEAADLPAAQIRYTISGSRDKREVSCAALELDFPATGPIRTETFDNDVVIVDIDSAGEIVGVEVTAYTHGPADLPELMTYVAENDLGNLFTYVLTIMHFWIHFKVTVEMEDAVNKVLRPLVDRVWNSRELSAVAAHEQHWA